MLGPRGGLRKVEVLQEAERLPPFQKANGPTLGDSVAKRLERGKLERIGLKSGLLDCRRFERGKLERGKLERGKLE